MSYDVAAVANTFAVEFFESLAKSPEALEDMFAPFSVLLINDFELGLGEPSSDAFNQFRKWAASVVGNKLIVDGVSGSPLYSGVVAYINFHCIGSMEVFYQMNVILENADDYNVFFIRQLTIARVGAVEVEAPPPAPEPVKPVKEKSVPPTPAAATPQKKADKSPAKKLQAEAAPAPAPVEGGAASSWKARVASPTQPIDESKCVVVVGGKVPSPTPAKESNNRKNSPKKEHPKREKKVSEPVGDRLMFNISTTLQDSEIRAALGPLANSLVSLRNNSFKGYVFMDFAEGVKAFDEMRKNPPCFGPDKKKVNVARQREKE